MCMRACACMSVSISVLLFFFCSFCCSRARYEFLPTTFEMICCVWAEHPRTSIWRRKKKIRRELYKRKHQHIDTMSHISQWMKRQWNTNTQQQHCICIVYYFTCTHIYICRHGPAHRSRILSIYAEAIEW